VLIFVGAIVRVTGSGMGCPDWPKCWGKLVPPTSLDGIEVDKLVEHESFITKYRDREGPDAILTEEALREMFNPVHTWIEYINRLFAMPIGLGSLFLLAYTQITWLKLKYRDKGRGLQKSPYKILLPCAYGAFILVIANALVGMLVVKTILHEGVITLHMALAMLLLCLLVYSFWKGADRAKFLKVKESLGKLKLIGWILFILIVVEGIMGSQVREMTDYLQKYHVDKPRAEWIVELEQAAVYVIHRSFSWGILVAAILFGWWNYKWTERRFTLLEVSIVGIVFAQMVLGLVLAHVGVLPVVQVLHVGLSSILVSGLFYWLLCARREPQQV